MSFLLVLLLACRVADSPDSPDPGVDPGVVDSGGDDIAADTADTADSGSEAAPTHWSPGTPESIWTMDASAGFALAVWVTDATDDGLPDVVVAARDVSEAGRLLRITTLPNDGHGGFGAPLLAGGDDSTTNSYSADLADVDGDGRLDVLVGTSRGFGVSFGNGAGFDPQEDHDLGWDYGSTANGVDLDGDGADEIVVSGGQRTGTAFGLYRAGPGGEEEPLADWSAEYPSGMPMVSEVVGYRDADGVPTAVFAGVHEQRGTGDLSAHADGAGYTLAYTELRLTGDGLYSGFSLDVDDDGALDVITEGSAGLEVTPPAGGGPRMLRARDRTTYGTFALPADLLGDGHPDVIEAVGDHSDQGGLVNLDLAVLPGDGVSLDLAEVFPTGLAFASTPTAVLGAGDLDGDGCGDVVALAGVYQDVVYRLPGRCE